MSGKNPMSRYLFEYSREYEPAAPVIYVNIKTRYGTSGAVPAFLDSGADGTIVPLNILQQIGARYIDKRQLSGITGGPQIVGLDPIQIQIGEETIYGIDAAGYGEEIILGRDALNQLVLLLNGPALATEITLTGTAAWIHS